MKTGYILLTHTIERSLAQVRPGDFAQLPGLRLVYRGRSGGCEPDGDALPAATGTEGSLWKSSNC